MLYEKKKRWVGLVLIVLTIIVIFSTPFQEFASIPDEVRLFEGKSVYFNLTLPTTGSVESGNPEIIDVTSGQSKSHSKHGIYGRESGTTDLQIMLGKFPIKQVKVDVLPDLKVYPGGQSIGVKLDAIGPLVVGHHFVKDGEGQKVSPGEKANIQIGDMIVKLNDVKVNSLKQVGQVVQESGEIGKKLDLELLRGKDTVNVSLNPVYDEKEKRHRLGLYLRHSAAGVGTLTFIEPNSGAYGALGHVISDVDTQKPIVVGQGNIVDSDVSSIEKGQRGVPGEKFSQLKENDILGDVRRNTAFGIFGQMKQNLKNGVMNQPISIGLSEEVVKGPAQILTVVEGHKVQKFDIEVVDIVQQDYPATKGLVVKVTDKELLEKTGGIVQGMSGSPIIQNNKLIGAVTHVFVNDPTTGYGCLIEWMLNDAGIPIKPDQKSNEREEEKPKAS